MWLAVRLVAREVKNLLPTVMAESLILLLQLASRIRTRTIPARRALRRRSHSQYDGLRDRYPRRGRSRAERLPLGFDVGLFRLHHLYHEDVG